MSIHFRRYADHDLQDYARTLMLTWPFDSISEATENAAVAVGRAPAADQTGELWVAEIRDVAVGFMLLEFSSEPSTDEGRTKPNSVEIDWLDVHPDYQRKGVGRALLEQAEERAANRLCLNMTIHTAMNNRAMLKLAQRCGFVQKERQRDFWGRGRGDAILLVKNLNSGSADDAIG